MHSYDNGYTNRAGLAGLFKAVFSLARHRDVTQNVGGGNRFALGEYYKDNETWVTDVATATIDYGPNSNWCTRPALVSR